MIATIYKGIGGFYYVKTGSGEMLEVKPRGIFRKRGVKPLAGDRVLLGREAETWFIEEIEPRKNAFVRPPVANVDLVFIVAATAQPVPSRLVIDKLAAVALWQKAQPVLLVTKTDLASGEALLQDYQKAGMQAFCVGPEQDAGLLRLRQMLPGRCSVFCGNSGVGKSTLLNALCPEAMRDTAAISQKLGRGRHTTREVEIFEVNGGLVADTPGFASVDLQQLEKHDAEDVQYAFPEIEGRMNECKFTGCSHVAETGCAVRLAVEQGEIAESRYESYRSLYRQAKENQRY